MNINAIRIRLTRIQRCRRLTTLWTTETTLDHDLALRGTSMAMARQAFVAVGAFTTVVLSTQPSTTPWSIQVLALTVVSASSRTVLLVWPAAQALLQIPAPHCRFILTCSQRRTHQSARFNSFRRTS